MTKNAHIYKYVNNRDTIILPFSFQAVEKLWFPC